MCERRFMKLGGGRGPWSPEADRIVAELSRIAAAINGGWACDPAMAELLRQRQRALTARLAELRQHEMAALAPAEPTGGGRRG